LDAEPNAIDGVEDEKHLFLPPIISPCHTTGDEMWMQGLGLRQRRGGGMMVGVVMLVAEEG